MGFDTSRFLARFIEETRDHCAGITSALLDLEKKPLAKERLNDLFRAAHTIKGSAKMMKLSGIAELAHHMEDVLDAMRNGRIKLTSAISDTLFRAVDAMTAMLAAVSSGDKSPDAPTAVCEALARTSVPALDMNTQNPIAPPITDQSSESTLSVSFSSPPPDSPTRADETGLNQTAGKGEAVDYLRIKASKLDELIRLMGEIVSEQGKLRRQIGRFRGIERTLDRHLRNSGGELEHPPPEKNKTVCEAPISAGAAFQETLRALSDTVQIQDQLFSELRESALKLRMLPLSTVFDPLRRTVRDLGRQYGKEIDFVLEGGETELDRKIINRIGDSLLHLIRNALDHGLEAPDTRRALGKPICGTIRLSASYEGGCVTISLADDGSGLQTDSIREKALARRLITAEALASMTRSEIDDIIFMPGFSTSPIITELSGRGVGMDVVRKNIVEELKGSITTDSRPGKGTTFLLKLPPNLAVFPLFLVSVSGKTCALPATSIVEVRGIRVDELIEILNKRALRLREQLVPVESMALLLNLEIKSSDHRKPVPLVILQEGNEKLGLMVDEIIGQEDMVVKPLPDHLRRLPMVSGVTIGEGDTIINVFHASGLIKSAKQINDITRKTTSPEKARKTIILVVDDSFNTREIEKSILEAYGYAVMTASDGEEALQKAGETQYDLIITDIEMPGIDGFRLTEALRNDNRYAHVPIIIVTSREKEEDKRRGIRVGANAYIVKGAFDQSNLIDTVRNLIG